MLISMGIGLLAAGVGWGIWLRLKKRRYYREWMWSMIVLLIGTALCMCLALRLPISSPTVWIKAVFAPIYKPISSWLEEDK